MSGIYSKYPVTEGGGSTIVVGSPANGLNITGGVLTIGLSSATTTGALSAFDFSTFSAGITNAAHRNLNNLVSPTSINQSLLFDTDLNYDIGATGVRLNNVYTQSVNGGLGSLTLNGSSIAFSSKVIRAFSALQFDGSTSGSITLTQPATITSYTLTLPNAQGAANTVPLNDGAGNLSWTPISTGSVTSVALADSTGLFNISGSPVTSTGTLTLASLQSKSANTVFAAPNGSAGAPTFRALVSADLGTNTVSNSNLAQMVAHTYKGNNTGSTANAIDVTNTQLTADLNLFSSSLQGLVPASGGGTTNFLRADGTFAAVPAGGVTTVGAFSASSQVNGATISGATITFGPADATNPGMLSTAAQTIAGAKTFSGNISAANLSGTNSGDVTIGVPANGLAITGQSLTLGAASAATTGALTASDWNVFNSKGPGTVSSVALTAPSIFTVSGSPVTGSGTLTLTYSGTALPIANGGTNATSAASAFNNLNPMTTTGDLIYEASASTAARLPIGTTGQILTVVAGLPAWAASGTSNVGISGSNWMSDLVWTTSGFGTPTFNAFYRRVGDTMEVNGYFTPPSVSGATAAIQLPSGFTIDYSKIPSGTSSSFAGSAFVPLSGGNIITQLESVLFYDGSTTNQIFFDTGSTRTNGQFGKQTDTAISGAGQSISFRCVIPISGWTVSNGSPTFQTYPIRTITSATTTLASDNYILVNGIAPITVTLMAPVVGQVYHIKNLSLFTTTIIPTSGTIDGSASITIAQNVTAALVTDGTNFFVV